MMYSAPTEFEGSTSQARTLGTGTWVCVCTIKSGAVSYEHRRSSEPQPLTVLEYSDLRCCCIFWWSSDSKGDLSNDLATILLAQDESLVEPAFHFVNCTNR